jgi:type II secretion system protein G
MAMDNAPASIALNDRGFTLIELFLVMVIIGILVLLSIPTYYNLVELAKVARCKDEIRGLEKAISAYTADKGTFPPDLKAIGQGTLLDPWGNHYVYRLATSTTGTPYTDLTGTPFNSDYDLYSTGKDGNTTLHLSSADADKPCQDDVIRAGDGARDELGSEAY